MTSFLFVKVLYGKLTDGDRLGGIVGRGLAPAVANAFAILPVVSFWSVSDRISTNGLGTIGLRLTISRATQRDSIASTAHRVQKINVMSSGGLALE